MANTDDLVEEPAVEPVEATYLWEPSSNDQARRWHCLMLAAKIAGPKEALPLAIKFDGFITSGEEDPSKSEKKSRLTPVK